MIYIFDSPEFQVLAAAKGIERYYGFPAAGEMSREQIFFSVYQLTKAGILKQEKDGLIIQPPVARYMDVIAAAEQVTIADSGQYRLPRQCIYVCKDEVEGDRRFVCMENSQTDPGGICLSGQDEDEVFLQLQDMGQLPGEHLTEDIGTYDFEGYWDRHMPEGLWGLLKQGLVTETEELLETEPVHSVFTLRDKAGGQIKERMALLDFALEYCMVLQSSKEMRLHRYQREAAWQVLKTWWRNEI